MAFWSSPAVKAQNKLDRAQKQQSKAMEQYRDMTKNFNSVNTMDGRVKKPADIASNAREVEEVKVENRQRRRADGKRRRQARVADAKVRGDGRLGQARQRAGELKATVDEQATSILKINEQLSAVKDELAENELADAADDVAFEALSADVESLNEEVDELADDFERALAVLQHYGSMPKSGGTHFDMEQGVLYINGSVGRRVDVLGGLLALLTISSASIVVPPADPAGPITFFNAYQTGDKFLTQPRFLQIDETAAGEDIVFTAAEVESIYVSAAAAIAGPLGTLPYGTVLTREVLTELEWITTTTDVFGMPTDTLSIPAGEDIADEVHAQVNYNERRKLVITTDVAGLVTRAVAELAATKGSLWGTLVALIGPDVAKYFTGDIAAAFGMQRVLPTAT